MTCPPALVYPVPIAVAGSYVPYVRRRNSPAQLNALYQFFQATPHPTRAQRQALADELGMELKSVTNWFQNRRQTARKKSLSCNENNPTKTMPLDRSTISLDRIAALSERPSLTSQSTSPRLPLTPRKSNVTQKDPPEPAELWTRMLSSPTAPPSSPDLAHLAVLSSRAKMLGSLEWACLKARQKKCVDEGADGLPRRPVLDDEDGTETEVVPVESRDASNVKSDLFSRPKITPQFEDVEAAITLLGFKTRW